MTQTEEDLVSNEVKQNIETVVKNMGVENATFDISEGAIKGDNYLGIVAKVEIKGEKNGKDVDLNFIVKSAPRTGIMRQMCFLESAYAREIYMYTKVLPEFMKLQKEHDVTDGFKAIARYYGSSLSDLSECLIMENMKAFGYQLFDRHQSMDYHHASMVIKVYGKYHALSYALKQQKPEVFQEFAENTEDQFFSNILTPDFQSAIKVQTDRALITLDPVQDKEAYNRFTKFQDTIFDMIATSVKGEEAGEYAVIGHGDCWVNNMLFQYEDPDKPNKPTNLCLLDWQLSRIGSPALDLSYFLFTCTDKALRDEYYDELFKEYYDSFSDLLTKLGGNPQDALPFDVLQEHMKRFSVYGLYMSIMALHFMTSEVDEIPDIHQITNMDEAKDKFEYVSKNVDKYNSRVRGVILDFVRLGYNF